MTKVERAAERFRRSMAAAAAKPARVARAMPSVPSMLLCAECYAPIPPGQEVYSADYGSSDVRVICYACKDIVHEEEDWDEEAE